MYRYMTCFTLPVAGDCICNPDTWFMILRPQLSTETFHGQVAFPHYFVFCSIVLTAFLCSPKVFYDAVLPHLVQRGLLRGFKPKCETTDPDTSTAAHAAAHDAAASSAVESKGDSLVIKRVAKGTNLRVRKHRSLVSDEVGLLQSGAGLR